MLNDFILIVLTHFSWLYFKFIHTSFTIWNFFKDRRSVTKPAEEDLNQLLLISATQAAEVIRHREIQAQQLVEVYIRRIQHIDSLVNAVVQENFDEALDMAKSVDKYLDSLSGDSDKLEWLEKNKPLLGVPFTTKDSIRIKGLRTICGIPNLVNAKVNEKDATVVKLLREAGAIHLASTNVSEAGLWWETSNKIFGQTRNPYDLRLTCGGSSGGEASLIAAAGSVIGVGSDFGGSIRIPSSFNGVFGFKPTPKLIPINGHIPDNLPEYHKEMMSIGPICRYAKDLTTMLKIMVGPENAKQLKLDEPVIMRNVRVFYMHGLESLVCSPLHEDCLKALQRSVKYFEKKYDNTVYNLNFPIAHHAVDLFITSSKTRDGLPIRNCLAGYTANKAINLWSEVLKFTIGQSKHSAAALQVAVGDELPNVFQPNKNVVTSKRAQLKRELTDLLGENGVLLFPSFCRPSYYHNEALFSPLDFVYTGLWNVLGLPVVACPMGLSSSGVPLSVQVIGAANADRVVLSVACDLEEGFGGWTPLEAD